MNRRSIQEGRNPVNAKLTKGKEIELKRAKAEWLKAVIDAIADAIVVVGVDGIVTGVNPAFTKMHGYKAEELVGANAAEVIPRFMGPNAMEKAMGIMKDVFEKGIVGKVEIIVKTKDGREFPVSAAFSPIKDAMGKITSMIVTIRDITEQKKMEEERIRAAAADRQRMEELERFTKVAVGRELKMVELKERIKELESKLEEITGKE